MEWVDESSYSRGQRGEVEPSVWELKGAPGRLTVHRYIGLEGWFVTCRDLDLERHELRARGAEEAKQEALDLALDTITRKAAAWQRCLASG